MLPKFLTKYWSTNTNTIESHVFKSDFKPFFNFFRLSYLSIAWFFFSVTTFGHFARDLKGNQAYPLINIDAKWTESYTNTVGPTHAFNPMDCSG